MRRGATQTPALAGVLDSGQVRRTARTIAAAQWPSGAIPWFPGGHVDPWDHVQAAMGLSAAGLHGPAERAYEWSRRAARPDGTWAIRYENDRVIDAHTDANFCAYLATGVWHHTTITGDVRFAERMWPVVEAGIEAALSLQRPDGAVAWARGEDGRPMPDALVTSNASIHLSVRCALALAGRLGEVRPSWELAAGRLRHVLDEHPEAFEPKPNSMDWYYPVLGGALPAEQGRARLDERWDEFVLGSMGVRCVSTNAWVTGAETCELVLALDAVGRRDAAIAALEDMQHLRDPDGSYWTGFELDADLLWPVERTTWTGATVILAVDALGRCTPGNGLFRGEGLPLVRWEMSEACSCL